MTVSTAPYNLLFLLLTSLTLLPSVTASCYFPNGTDQNAGEQADQGIVYTPCNSHAENSMCCAPWDTCTSDGLCKSGYDGNTWRDSCTDPTWKSPACVKLCVSGFDEAVIEAQTNLNMADNDVTVTRCPTDGSYCCGNGTAAVQCCHNHLGVWIDPVSGRTTNKNPNGAGVASYVTPPVATATSLVSSTKGLTSGLPLPVTGLSSYAWSSSLSAVPLAPLTTSLATTSLPVISSGGRNASAHTPTGNVSTSAAVAAANTSVASFNPKSSAPMGYGSLGYDKPIAGFVFVAGLFLVAT